MDMLLSQSPAGSEANVYGVAAASDELLALPRMFCDTDTQQSDTTTATSASASASCESVIDVGTVLDVPPPSPLAAVAGAADSLLRRRRRRRQTDAPRASEFDLCARILATYAQSAETAGPSRTGSVDAGRSVVPAATLPALATEPHIALPTELRPQPLSDSFAATPERARLLFAGPWGVGKTHLLHMMLFGRLAHVQNGDTIEEAYEAQLSGTGGGGTGRHVVGIDTGGLPDYISVAELHLPTSDLVVLVFDASRPHTIVALQRYADAVHREQLKLRLLPVVLVATKCDLAPHDWHARLTDDQSHRLRVLRSRFGRCAYVELAAHGPTAAADAARLADIVGALLPPPRIARPAPVRPLPLDAASSSSDSGTSSATSSGSQLVTHSPALAAALPEATTTRSAPTARTQPIDISPRSAVSEPTGLSGSPRLDDDADLFGALAPGEPADPHGRRYSHGWRARGSVLGSHTPQHRQRQQQQHAKRQSTGSSVDPRMLAAVYLDADGKAQQQQCCVQ